VIVEDGHEVIDLEMSEDEDEYDIDDSLLDLNSRIAEGTVKRISEKHYGLKLPTHSLTQVRKDECKIVTKDCRLALCSS